MRTNGLQTPYNGMQITTWILFPILTIQFCVFITPNLPLPISIPATILFLLFGIISLYFGYTTSKTDSIDIKLYQHINNRPHPRAAEKEAEQCNTKYCWVCQTNVYEGSMHCKYCDKCVSTFDHHCMWLNNCIGDQNYGYFYKTVWFTCLFIFVHIISLIIYLALYFTGHDETKQLSKNWMDAQAALIIVGVNIGFLVITGFAGLLVLQLLFFHISLRKQKITTYQFIIRDGQQKRDQWNFQQKVNQKRGQMVEAAQHDGKCVQACWLSLGAKYCKTCDPVIPKVREEMDAVEVGNADTGKGNVDEEKKSEEEQANGK